MMDRVLLVRVVGLQLDIVVDIVDVSILLLSDTGMILNKRTVR